MMCEQKCHPAVQKAFEGKCGIIDKNWMSYAFMLFIEIETGNLGLSAKEELNRLCVIRTNQIHFLSKFIPINILYMFRID